MKGYISILKIRIIRALQYRAAAWAGVFTQLFWGILRIMILVAFYRSATSQPPVPLAQMADYVWLGQAFLMLTILWVQDGKLLQNITDGNIAYELCRPYRIYPFWFMRTLSMRIALTMMRCLPILLVAGLLPEPYRMHLPAGVAALVLFLLSLALGTLLAVALSMLVYLMTFYTMSAHGPRFIVGLISDFMMGIVVPIPLMPDAVQKIMNLFPFRYMADVPFRIYSGNIVGVDIISTMGVQVFWLAAIILLGSMGFQKVQKHVLVQGG